MDGAYGSFPLKVVLVDIDTKDEGNPPTKTTEAFQMLVNRAC
jgi:hypothetical protein